MEEISSPVSNGDGEDGLEVRCWGDGGRNTKNSSGSKIFHYKMEVILIRYGNWEKNLHESNQMHSCFPPFASFSLFCSDFEWIFVDPFYTGTAYMKMFSF